MTRKTHGRKRNNCTVTVQENTTHNVGIISPSQTFIITIYVLAQQKTCHFKENNGKREMQNLASMQ
jgi:hypothetical protein